MKFLETELPGVIVIEPDVFEDGRGFFMETYPRDKFQEAGIEDPFVLDAQSHSPKDTLRGLHYQEPHPQGKIVRVINGSVFDVTVDIRTGSPNFKSWTSTELSAENKRQLWIPPGFAHGFYVLSDSADVLYKMTDAFHPENSRRIRWNDPEIGIAWPTDHPLVSEADAAAPLLADASSLPQHQGEK